MYGTYTWQRQNEGSSQPAHDQLENHQLTVAGAHVTWVDMSNSSALLARVSRALPLRVNGDVVRRAALDFGDAALAGEWDDTTLRCMKLPSGLRGDGEASLLVAVTG